MSYSDNRKEHLCKYAAEQGYETGGVYRGKKYKHILNSNSMEQKDVIMKNLVGTIRLDGMDKARLHPNAHHLNSSQMLCYNFFRPMLSIESEGLHPKQELIDFIWDILGVEITIKAKCEFEHKGDEPGKGKKTEFDFFINDEKARVEIGFEIKYTEQNFGRVSKPSDGQRKRYKCYMNKVNECICLRKDVGAPSEDDFFRNYQLFRNVVRVDNENAYSIFLFPKENKALLRKYVDFQKQYFSPECKNVKAIYWEDLMKGKEYNELYKKYFE